MHAKLVECDGNSLRLTEKHVREMCCRSPNDVDVVHRISISRDVPVNCLKDETLLDKKISSKPAANLVTSPAGKNDNANRVAIKNPI